MSDNAFWIIIILAFAVVYPLAQSWIRSRYKSESPPDEARNVLENRYALGEIDDEEFARRMEQLTKERISFAQRKRRLET